MLYSSITVNQERREKTMQDLKKELDLIKKYKQQSKGNKHNQRIESYNRRIKELINQKVYTYYWQYVVFNSPSYISISRIRINEKLDLNLSDAEVEKIIYDHDSYYKEGFNE